MKVLLDINVVLDVLLDRSPWVGGAKGLWQACDDGRVEGFLASFSIPTIFYIVRKASGIDRAREAVRVCLDAFHIIPVDERTLEMAFASSGNDFEDNVQVACAMIAGVDCIASRDATGLSNPVIPVRNAEEIVATL